MPSKLTRYSPGACHPAAPLPEHRFRSAVRGLPLPGPAQPSLLRVSCEHCALLLSILQLAAKGNSNTSARQVVSSSRWVAIKECQGELAIIRLCRIMEEWNPSKPLPLRDMSTIICLRRNTSGCRASCSNIPKLASSFQVLAGFGSCVGVLWGEVSGVACGSYTTFGGTMTKSGC